MIECGLNLGCHKLPKLVVLIKPFERLGQLVADKGMILDSSPKCSTQNAIATVLRIAFAEKLFNCHGFDTGIAIVLNVIELALARFHRVHVLVVNVLFDRMS